MVPTTDDVPPDIAEFYNALAEAYDAMTDLTGRFAREEPALRSIVDRFVIRTAIDAGSGTGFHTLLLARLGVATTAVDVSPVMLGRVQENASRFGLRVETLHAALGDLTPAIIPPADAVFCMGNTLAHLSGPAALLAAMRAFHTVIRPGGVLVCHLLNYAKIVAARERIQNIREAGGVTFIRFYDFEPGRVVFNILRIERGVTGLQHTLTSVPLHPFTHADMLSALAEAGFLETRVCEDLTLTPFRESASRDLFVLATRPA